MKSLIIKRSDLSIASRYDGSADQSKYGGPWGDPEQYLHMDFDENEMDADCVIAELDGEEIVLAEDQDLLDAKLQAGREAKLSLMRNMRDVKLLDVDIMVNELTLGERADTAAVALYRNQLKGITDSYKNMDGSAKDTLDALEADLSDLSWPASP